MRGRCWLALCLVTLGIVMPRVVSASSVRLVVAYCPTDFTGEGAIVDVDPHTGNWSIATKFQLPSEVFGCVADYSPSYDVDRTDPNTVWLDFTSDEGFFVAVDTRFGNTSHFSSSNWFFTGYENFKYSKAFNVLRGVTMTVTESGFCSDGCAAFGNQALPPASKHYEQLALVPFKAVSDDTSFYNPATNTFSFQGSYDLRPVTCAPEDDEECLITLDAATGTLVSAIYTPHYHVYRFSPRLDAGKSLSFVVGFNAACKNPPTANATQYAFALVDPVTADSKLVSCVSASIIVQEGPWIGAFSPDNTMFATSSGNGDGDRTQFLVLDTASGAEIINAPLVGLAAALGAKMGLVFVWSLEFVGSNPATR